MINSLAHGFFWLRERSFFRVVQRTFVMLMPVATLGAYFKILRDGIFSPKSLVYNLFNFDNLMSNQVWQLCYSVSNSIVNVTLGLFGIYVAYFAAMYTARLYRKDATMAGLTAVLVIVFCAYLTGNTQSSSKQIVFYSRILNINGVLISMVIGYAIGQIFHFYSKNYVHVNYEHVKEIQKRVWQSLRPMAITILLGLILGLILYYFKIQLLDSSAFKSLVAELRSSNRLVTIVPLTILSSLLWWSGIGYPLQSLTSASNSGAALVNLNYALRHGSAHNVPYKYLGSSLVGAYGLMGDAAVILSLTVVLILFTHNKEIEAIAKLNLLPVAFGAKTGLAIGVPIILNPLFLLPVVFIPAINELLAAAAINLNWITPAVYPVLNGTPGILLSFFASNGNWPTFIFTILLFILDILMMISVALIGERLDKEVNEYDQKITLAVK